MKIALFITARIATFIKGLNMNECFIYGRDERCMTVYQLNATSVDNLISLYNDMYLL